MRLERIVVTNDDGIDAPGLAVAEALAAELAEQVWTFAPATDQSGMAQALSMHHPLRVQAHGERRYAVTGTPADCVMAALGTDLMNGDKPDLVISGVNWGHNLSDSVMYSGTVGAAVAAAHFALPTIALSQEFRDRSRPDFSVTEAWMAAVVDRLWAVRDQFGCVWNVNFPAGMPEAIGGLRFTRQSTGSMVAPRLVENVDARGLTYHWMAFERSLDAVTDELSDVAALRDGYVSATPLQCERYDEQRLGAIGLGREWSLGGER